MASYLVPAARGGLTVGGVGGGGAGQSSPAFMVLGYVGTTFAALLLLAPMMTFVKPVSSDKSVGDRTVYAFLLTLFNTVIWALYAVPSLPDTFLAVVVNGAGVLLYLFYIVTYIRFADGSKRRCALGLLFAVSTISAVTTALVGFKVVHAGDWDITFVAVIASVTASFTYASVCFDLAVVLDTKNVNNMSPLLQLLMSLLSTCVWTVYASNPLDLYVLVPNAIGVAFTMAQLAVYLNYRSLPREYCSHADAPDYGSELRDLFSSPV